MRKFIQKLKLIWKILLSKEITDMLAAKTSNNPRFDIETKEIVPVEFKYDLSHELDYPDYLDNKDRYHEVISRDLGAHLNKSGFITFQVNGHKILSGYLKVVLEK